MGSLANKALLGAAFVLGLGLVIMDAPTAADPSAPPAEDLTEPVTGDPSDGFPTPGSETGPINPFEPPAPHASDVQFEDLTPEEQAYVEANADTSAWPAIHNAFAAATTQASDAARAQAAANLLGIDGFASVGVIP